jgi:hypothetical protein
MTPTQFAILLIRFYCILAFVFAMVDVTEIAYGTFVVISSPPSQYESARIFLLAMYVLRFFLYFSTGIISLIFTRPLARLLAQGLGNMKHDD